MKYLLKVFLASVIGFTINGLVFIRALVSDYKPVSSCVLFDNIVLPLASLWRPIVGRQK